MREDEALKLEVELEEARRQMEENQQALEEARSAQSLLLEQKLEEARLKEEEVMRLQREMEEARQKMADNERALKEARSSVQSLPMEQKVEDVPQKENKYIQTGVEEANEKVAEERVLEEVSSTSLLLLEKLEEVTQEEEEAVTMETYAEACQKLEDEDELEEVSITESSVEQKSEEIDDKEEETFTLQTEVTEIYQKIENDYVIVEYTTESIILGDKTKEEKEDDDDDESRLPEDKTLTLQTEVGEVHQKVEDGHTFEFSTTQSILLEQKLDEVGVKEERRKAEESEKLKEATQEALALQTEVEEVRQKVDEDEREVDGDHGNVQSSPVVLVSMQHPLTVDAEDEDDNVVCEDVERRRRSSSRSSSGSHSSHSHHSSYNVECSDEATAITMIATSPSVDEQHSERLSEPETPREHSKYSM